jgi:hypothetical protein
MTMTAHRTLLGWVDEIAHALSDRHPAQRSDALAPFARRRTLDELQVVELGDELGRLRKRAGDDRLRHFEKLEYPVVGDRIQDRRAFLARLEDVRAAKHSELLREMGRLKTDFGDQFSDGALAVSQELEDANTRRMGKGLEEICLHLVDRSSHWSQPRLATKCASSTSACGVWQLEKHINLSFYQRAHRAVALGAECW